MRIVAASSSRCCWSPSLSSLPFVLSVGGAAFFSVFLSTATPTSFSTRVCAQSSYGPPTTVPNGSIPPAGSPPATVPNGSIPPAGSPPANAPNGSIPPVGSPSPNATQSNASPASTAETEKTVASETLAPLFQAPASTGAVVGGVPLPLEKLLFGISAPFERNRRILGYWELSEKYAAYNNFAQCAALANKCVDRIVKKYGAVSALPAESRAAMAASQRVAKERGEAARLAFFKAQLDFDAAFSSSSARRAAVLAAKSGEKKDEKSDANAALSETPASSADFAATTSELAAKGTILYVPTAIPTTLKYNARFEELSRTRRLSREAARLNVALPLLYQSLENRAQQAQQAFSNLTVAFSAAQPDEGILFNLLDRYASARAELLSVAIRYNRTIALYVAEAGPGRSGVDLYLAMLKQKATPAAASTASVPKTFVDDSSSRAVAGGRVAPSNAESAAANNGVRPASYSEGAPPTSGNGATDLTPTPGARFELADVPASPQPLAETSSNAAQSNAEAAPSEAVKPLPETPSAASPASEPVSSPPTAPTPPESASPAAETPSEGEDAAPVSASVDRPTAIVLAGYERKERDAKTQSNDDAQTLPDAFVRFPTVSEVATVYADSFDLENADLENAPIIRGQTPAPDAASTPQNQPQKPVPVAPNDAAQKRVLETTAALFAAKPEPASAEEAIPETPVSFREALARVPATPEARAAVVRAYWLLQANCARCVVESSLLTAYSQAIDAFNAKLTEQKKAGTESDPVFVATAGAYLAAAREAQARVAEARLLKRESQLDLCRLTARSVSAGWPVPSTLPFCGPSFEFETPRMANAVVVQERALIPEKMKIVQKIGSEFGPPATLFSPEVPSVLDGNPFVSLTTLEKKREAALLFVELVVSLNVSTGDYVANFPAGYVSPDRFAKALVGDEK